MTETYQPATAFHHTQPAQQATAFSPFASSASSTLGCDIDDGVTTHDTLPGALERVHTASPLHVSASVMQPKLNDAYNTYNNSARVGFHARSHTMTIFTAVVIDVATDIASLLPRPNTIFAEIAARCPMREENVQKRYACAQYIGEVLDKLIEELLEGIESKSALLTQPAGKLSPEDTLLLLDVQKMIDTMQTLHFIANLQLMHNERTAQSQHALKMCTAARMDVMLATFNPVACHTTSTSKAPTACVVCSTNLSEDVSACMDITKQQRVVLACCGGNHSICNLCLLKHLFTSSQYGAKSFGTCPMCRHHWQLYERV